MSSLSPFLQRNKASIQFGAYFVGLSGLFYLIYYALRSYGNLSFLKAATAVPVWVILRLFFQDAILSSDIISLDVFQIRIIYECTGIFLMIIFCACVLAYPASWRAKVIGLAAGIPIIYLTNILRLALLALVGRSFPSYFQYFHDYFWYGTFSLIIIFTWIFWLEIVVERGKQKTLSR